MVLTLAACNLDRFPLDRLTYETYFTTETELDLYANQFYTIFPGESSIVRESVDNVITNNLPDEIAGTRLVPTSGGDWGWSHLRKHNTLLENSHKCKDEEAIPLYNAVARFFRAYFYYEKVKRFGDVPWYDRTLGTVDEGLYQPRDSREFIMQRIIEDLDFAIANLPYEKSLYKISRWTALALKSRACLFEGTFRKYHGITLDGNGYEYYLEQAAGAAEEFIRTSGYKLQTGVTTTCYRDLFAANNATPDMEIILARDYSNTLNMFHNANFYTLASSMGRPGLSRRIVNSYLMNDGSRFTDKAGYETMSFADETKDRDPRLAQTIRTPGYTRIGQSALLAPDFRYTVTGYHPVKYVTTTDQDGSSKSYNDLPIFRTAEVYLNYAEAKAELGSLSQNDLDMTVNRLRARVGMPDLDMAAANASPDPYLSAAATGYPNVAGTNKGVILEIRRERGVELIMEGFRYFDMMRWKEGKAFEQPMYGLYFPGPGAYDLDGNGTLDFALNTDGTNYTAAVAYKIGVDVLLSNGTSGYISPHQNSARTWDEGKDYLYPIPYEELALSKGGLVQNPGWDEGF